MTAALRWTQYLAFVSLGLTMSIFGPLLTTVQAEISLSDFQSGLVLSGQFLGMLVSVPAGGYLADRFGKKPFLLASSLVTVAGLLGFVGAHSFGALLATSVVTGVGGGGYEVGVNALQADHAEERSGSGMNILHFFYGAGAVSGPILATLVVKGGLDWRIPFAAAAALPLAVGALLLRQPVSAGRPAGLEAAAIYRSGALWWWGLFITVYVGIETSVGGWIATFCERRAGGPLPPQLVPLLFWGTVTAGRLLCGTLTDRVGLGRFLSLASGLTLVLAAGWSLSSGPIATLAAVVLLGLSLAGIFPTTMALVTGRFPGHSGKVVGLLTVFAAVGGFAFPSGVGRLADLFGIGVLPPVAAVLALVLLAGVRAAR
jgi:fucose permease